MSMDWDKLKAFYAVAEVGSFTHASEKLNLSQSSISRQISALEESLSTTLFHRHARGLILTEQGEMLYDTVRSIFRQLSLIEGQLHDIKNLPEGPLLMTVAEFIGSTWLAPLLPKFLKEHNGIKLSMILEDRVLNLGMREADAAIRLFKPEQQDLIQLKLGDIQFSLCASPDYLGKRGTPKTINELQGHRLIGHPQEAPNPYQNPNWHFDLADINPQTYEDAFFINSINSITEAVKQGWGIAALPDFIIEREKTFQKVLKDDATHEIAVYFVYPEEHKNSKRINLLKDFLIKEMQNIRI